MARRQAPPPSLLTVRIVWGALFASQGIYLAVLRMPGVVPTPLEPPSAEELSSLVGAAVVAAIGSYALPWYMWKNAAQGSIVKLVDVPTAAVSASYRAPVTSARGFADRDAAMRQAMMRGFAPFIVGAALNESVAIFGFLLGFLGHGLFAYLPLFVVAWVLMAFRFPTENTFLKPFAAAHGVTL